MCFSLTRPFPRVLCLRDGPAPLGARTGGPHPTGTQEIPRQDAHGLYKGDQVARAARRAPSTARRAQNRRLVDHALFATTFRWNHVPVFGGSRSARSTAGPAAISKPWRERRPARSRSEKKCTPVPRRGPSAYPTAELPPAVLHAAAEIRVGGRGVYAQKQRAAATDQFGRPLEMPRRSGRGAVLERLHGDQMVEPGGRKRSRSAHRIRPATDGHRAGSSSMSVGGGSIP